MEFLIVLTVVGIMFVAFLVWVINNHFYLRRRLDKLEKALQENIQQLAAPERIGVNISGKEKPELQIQEIPPTTALSYVKTGSGDIESIIGRHWLPLVGIIAVVFGASFFLKYAFENNLITVTARVLLGTAAGFILVGLGEYWKTKYQKFSYILSGGGIALLYLSAFASFYYYNLIGQAAAFGFMVAITLLCAILALRYNAQLLAVVGVLGGLLTPYLLSTGVDRQIALFTYIALLNIGVLILGYVRNWRKLNVVGLVGSAIIFYGWYATYYGPEKFGVTILFLSIFFAEYLFSATPNILSSKKQALSSDLALITLNAGWFFGWGYYLLSPHYEQYLWLFALTVAAVYSAMAYMTFAFKRSDKNLYLMLGGLGFVFLSVVLPIYLESNWITIGLAAEAVVLSYLGSSMSSREIRFAAFAALAASILRLVFFDTAIHNAVYTLLFNERFVSYLVVALAGFAAAHILRGNFAATRENADEKEKLFIALTVVWNILLLAALSLELVSYFDKKIAGAQSYLGYDSIVNQRNASLSAFWSLYAIALLVIGMVKKYKSVRLGGLALFGVTAVKVFTIDLANLPTLYRFVSFIVLGVILMVASYLYWRNQKRDVSTTGPIP